MVGLVARSLGAYPDARLPLQASPGMTPSSRKPRLLQGSVHAQGSGD